MNGLGNNTFHPSAIEDTIYDILDNIDYLISSKEYSDEAVPEIMEYLNNCGVQYSIITDPYPDTSGASVSICWVENNYLHHLVINVRF